jgi:protein-L-isoaspartate(D-aspartate) O-methyltransferase
MLEPLASLVERGELRTPALIKAFERVKRHDFLPAEMTAEEGVDAPLPIGHGQTNSQPFTVAFMLELLQPQSGQRILDIGSGSGWTTALLADVVGPKGKVFAIERVSELKKFGEENVKKYNFSNVEFFCRDGSQGLPEAAPFDRILVSAAATEVPPILKQQLVVSGRMVIPTDAEDIRLIQRLGDEKFSQEKFPGFLFVPLIKD